MRMSMEKWERQANSTVERKEGREGKKERERVKKNVHAEKQKMKKERESEVWGLTLSLFRLLVLPPMQIELHLN